MADKIVATLFFGIMIVGAGSMCIFAGSVVYRSGGTNTHQGPIWPFMAAILVFGGLFLLGPVTFLWRVWRKPDSKSRNAGSESVPTLPEQGSPRGFTSRIDREGRTVLESTGFGHGAYRTFFTVFTFFWILIGVVVSTQGHDNESLGRDGRLHPVLIAGLIGTWLFLLHGTARMYFEKLRIVLGRDHLVLERGMRSLHPIARIPKGRIRGITMEYEGTDRSSIKTYRLVLQEDREHTLSSGQSQVVSKWLKSRLDSWTAIR